MPHVGSLGHLPEGSSWKLCSGSDESF